VSSFFSAVTRSFLIKHSFLSEDEPECRRSRGQETPSPSKKRRVTTEADDLGKIPFPPLHAAAIHAEAAPLASQDNDDDHEVVWIDPTTAEVFVVDQRTGNSHLRKPTIHQREAEHDIGSSHRRTLPQKAQDVKDEKDSSMPHWIQAALQVSTLNLSFQIVVLDK